VGLFFFLIKTNATVPQMLEFVAGLEGNSFIEQPPFVLPTDSDDLIYPIEEGFGWNNNNPFNLQPSDSVSVTYDPVTGQYFINDPFNPENSEVLSFDEFWERQDEEIVQDYWEDKSNDISPDMGGGKLFSDDGILQVSDSSRLGGFLNGADVDIRPSGGVELLLGFRKQKIENPTLPTRLQNQPAQPDFDMNINMSVLGKIGDNLNFNLNYNTKTTFDFENRVKLEYTGDEDDIVQKVEAGHIGFQLPTQLIPGSQSLFGIKTQLQFGRLTATTVISQQKSSNECITIQNGAQVEDFEIYADQFEENRHFFLSQYFKDNYNGALETLPYINSDVIVTYVEVWVSNRTGATSQTRNIVAMSDLGEEDPFRRPQIKPQGTGEYPDNNANDLYGNAVSKSGSRDIDQAVSALQNNLGLDNVEDFRLIEARRLQPNEFTYDPQLGFISLNSSLQATDVLGVAFEYQNIWGERFQVGEFARDVTPDFEDSGREEVIFTKMLKTIDQRPNIPLWDLMMRNVYSLGAYSIEEKGFRLNVFYDTPGGGATRFLPEGESIRDKILIRLLGFDNLDYQKRQIPGGDGVFDMFDANDLNYQNQNAIPSQNNANGRGQGGGRGSGGNNYGTRNDPSLRSVNNARYYSTLNKRNGRIYFPVLKPFGDDLKKQFADNEQAVADAYSYDLLYDTTRIIARQFPEKNRFSIRGRYTSSTSSEFSLGAFNIPQNSIIVTAGGKRLVEGQDYTVNYSLGRVTLLNDAYLSSGIPIRICYEDPALFSIQQKNYFGTRLDYWINDDFTFGGTYVQLSQRPFTQKVNYGDDAIRNAMAGLDMNFYKDAPGITRFVDKIPGIDTKEKSSIAITAEGAKFIPGHAKLIDLGSGGVVFLDDFEGTQNQISMEFPLNRWQLASTPRNGKFDFAEAQNDLRYGQDRARFSWYTMDLPALGQELTAGSLGESHYSREVRIDEIFPQRDFNNVGLNRLRTFDLSYFPSERGPYNFNVDGLDQEGNLVSPETRWGGMMRELDLNDFQFHNIEFIEFWMLDPFLEDVTNEGEMYIDLGTVSEDVLKDGRRSFENGLPLPGQPENTDTTSWARVSRNNVITRFFDSDTLNRKAQDVGLDGLDNTGETFVFQDYLNQIAGRPDLNQDVKDAIAIDPANDDFRFFINAGWPETTGAVERYKRYNSPQGNSVTVDNNNNNNFVTSSTNLPDNEDLNQDNALEVAESFFEYKIKLEPDMQVGDSYITTVRVDTRDESSPNGVPARWLKFQIPIREFERAVGGIQGFTSIQFMRLYMTGFERPVVCRMTEFNLIRNQWRKYDPLIFEEGEYQPNDNSFISDFNVNSVSLEQSYEKEPVPYRLPPGTVQERIFSNSSQALRQNEQAISLEVCDLEDGAANAVFKTERYDMRQFERLQMWLHAEEAIDSPTPLEDGDLSAVIRIGSDFTQNYYEYEVPLTVTPEGNYGETTGDRYVIWPQANFIDVALDDLVELKKIRNFTLDSPSFTKPYSRFEEIEVTDSLTGESRKLRRKLTIVGSPDLGKVTTIMLAVRNPKRTDRTIDVDDGLSKCAEVWFNELALAGFKEEGGYAALARADIKLADFGNVTLAGSMHTAGFGTLEQRVVERSQDNLYQYDATGNFNLDKFLPKESGIKIPLYVGYSESVSNPKYDPYNTDVILKEALDSVQLYKGKESRDSVKRQAQTYTSIKSANLTNVRKVRTNTEKKPMPWDIENFNLSASYTETNFRDPYIEAERERRHRGEIGYAYNARPNYIKPFEKAISSKNKYLKLIRDFNFNIVPSTISFRTDLDRLQIDTKLRNLVGDKFEIPTIYNRDFLWGRHYGLKYDFSKALSLDFTSSNTSRVEEPWGPPTQATKDSLWASLKRGGRTMEYNQTATIKYNVPIEKLPFLDWTKLRTTYGTTYRWLSGPIVLADSLNNGATVSNSQNIQINGELNFTKLYSKSKFLRSINKPSFSSGRGDSRGRGKEKPEPEKPEGEEDKKKKRKPGEASPLAKAVISPLIMLKRASITYNERRATDIPGFVPQAGILGQNWRGNTTAPGLNYMFGIQPNDAWLDDAAAKGWITSNKQLNQQVRQTTSRDFRGKVSLEPYRGFKIDLNWTYNYSELYTELFKVDRMGEFQHLGPNKVGSYSVSYLPIRTAFDVIDTMTNLSETYQQYEANRAIISQRLGKDNLPATGTFYSPKDSTFLNDYVRGYGPYQQDVVLYSFLAAYNGIDANNMSLTKIFNQIPLPNWSISYNGLSKLKAFQKIFTSFNLTHRYNSTFTVNNFSNEQRYDGRVYDINPQLIAPYVLDTVSGNFYSLFRIPDIQISEQFAPLIGVDMTFTNNFTTRVEYRKTRSLGLSMGIDFQLNETKSQEFIIGAGYQVTGLVLPFKGKSGENVVLENDLTFQLDFSISDNITAVYGADQAFSQPVTGTKTIRLSPTIDYVVNERIRLTAYYDRTKTIPYTSQSYPTTNTKGGIRVSFSLAQ